MKEIILEILKRWAEADVNLQSEAARKAMTQEILQSFTEHMTKFGTSIAFAEELRSQIDNDIYG